MNKRITIFIVVIISIAITGLLAMEGVLVNMLMLKWKQRFEYVINAALSNTIQQLYQKDIDMKNFDGDHIDHMYQYGSMLDSLLGAELTKMKITSEYDCGLYSFTDKIMFYHKGTSDIKSLINSNYYYVIYLDNNNTSAASLLLHFPQETKFMLARLYSLLASIFVLILLIICIFVWAIIITYRQEKLGKMKKNLMLNIAHELKTPITTIKLSTEALKDESLQFSHEQLQDHLSIILDEDKRMQSMVEQMLHYTKLNASEFKIDLKQVNIKAVILGAIRSMGIQIRAQKATVTTQFNATNNYVLGDKTNLHNIFTNILDNALKYNDKDCKIKISTENKYHSIIICIEDNGIGVTRSQQKRIFDQFYRAPSGSAFNSKGFGLGLNYVKIIVEKHNGTISIKSQPQEWTQFIIKIPTCKKNKSYE